ncbi:hypothetical protein Golomagni_06810 [Golovinomyces magnicellulatus]|nr:hypothetical protein Golomagni_06810 [Golovinomyces magnicellulatus]
MSFNLSKPDRPIHVGVFLTNGITEILDTAPVDLLSGFDKHIIETFPEGFIPAALKTQALEFVYHWVNETGGPARLTSGLNVTPTDSFESCPPLDIIIIGAHNLGYEPNAAELDFVRKTFNSCSAFITTCAGVDVAVKAGVLSGKTATGPRFLLGQMKETAADINWVEKRWVRDGKIWTSGALLNGLDVMTAFIEQTWDVQEGDLKDFMLKAGGKVVRDVDYKDVSWVM